MKKILLLWVLIFGGAGIGYGSGITEDVEYSVQLPDVAFYAAPTEKPSAPAIPMERPKDESKKTSLSLSYRVTPYFGFLKLEVLVKDYDIFSDYVNRPTLTLENTPMTAKDEFKYNKDAFVTVYGDDDRFQFFEGEGFVNQANIQIESNYYASVSPKSGREFLQKVIGAISAGTSETPNVPGSGVLLPGTEPAKQRSKKVVFIIPYTFPKEVGFNVQLPLYDKVNNTVTIIHYKTKKDFEFYEGEFEHIKILTKEPGKDAFNNSFLTKNLKVQIGDGRLDSHPEWWKLVLQRYRYWAYLSLLRDEDRDAFKIPDHFKALSLPIYKHPLSLDDKAAVEKAATDLGKYQGYSAALKYYNLINEYNWKDLAAPVDPKNSDQYFFDKADEGNDFILSFKNNLKDNVGILADMKVRLSARIVKHISTYSGSDPTYDNTVLSNSNMPFRMLINTPFNNKDWYQNSCPYIWLDFLYSEKMGRPLLRGLYKDKFPDWNHEQLRPVSESFSNRLGMLPFSFLNATTDPRSIWMADNLNTKRSLSFQNWLNTSLSVDFVSLNPIKKTASSIVNNYGSHSSKEGKITFYTQESIEGVIKNRQVTDVAKLPNISRIEAFTSKSYLQNATGKVAGSNTMEWTFPGTPAIQYLLIKNSSSILPKGNNSSKKILIVVKVEEPVGEAFVLREKTKEVKYISSPFDYQLYQFDDPEPISSIFLTKDQGTVSTNLSVLAFEGNPVDFGTNPGSASISFFDSEYDHRRNEKATFPIFSDLNSDIFKSDVKSKVTKYQSWGNLSYLQYSISTGVAPVVELYFYDVDKKQALTILESTNRQGTIIKDELASTLDGISVYNRQFQNGSFAPKQFGLDLPMTYQKGGNDGIKLYNSKIFFSSRYSFNFTEADALNLPIDGNWNYVHTNYPSATQGYSGTTKQKLDSSLKDWFEYPFLAGRKIPTKSGIILNPNSPLYLGKLAGIDSLGLLSQCLGLINYEETTLDNFTQGINVLNPLYSVFNPKGQNVESDKIISPRLISKNSGTEASFGALNRSIAMNETDKLKENKIIEISSNGQVIPLPEPKELPQFFKARISEIDIETITVPVIDPLSMRVGDLLVGQENGETVVGIIYSIPKAYEVAKQAGFDNGEGFRSYRDYTYVTFISAASGVVTVGRWGNGARNNVFGGFTLNPDNFIVRRLVRFDYNIPKFTNVNQDFSLYSNAGLQENLRSAVVAFRGPDPDADSPKFIIAPNRNVSIAKKRIAYPLGKLFAKENDQPLKTNIKTFKLEALFGGDWWWPVKITLRAKTRQDAPTGIEFVWEHERQDLTQIISGGDKWDEEQEKYFKWSKAPTIELTLQTDGSLAVMDGAKTAYSFFEIEASYDVPSLEGENKVGIVSNTPNGDFVWNTDDMVFPIGPIAGGRHNRKATGYIDLTRMIMQELRIHLIPLSGGIPLKDGFILGLDQKLLFVDTTVTSLLEKYWQSATRITTSDNVPIFQDLIDYFLPEKKDDTTEEIFPNISELIFSKLQGSFAPSVKVVSAVYQNPKHWNKKAFSHWKIVPNLGSITKNYFEFFEKYIVFEYNTEFVKYEGKFDVFGFLVDMLNPFPDTSGITELLATMRYESMMTSNLGRYSLLTPEEIEAAKGTLDYEAKIIGAALSAVDVLMYAFPEGGKIVKALRKYGANIDDIKESLKKALKEKIGKLDKATSEEKEAIQEEIIEIIKDVISIKNARKLERWENEELRKYLEELALEVSENDGKLILKKNLPDNFFEEALNRTGLDLNKINRDYLKKIFNKGNRELVSEELSTFLKTNYSKLGMSPKMVAARIKALQDVKAEFPHIEDFSIVSRSRPEGAAYMDEFKAASKLESAETVELSGGVSVKKDPPGLRLVRNKDKTLQLIVSDDDPACFMNGQTKLETHEFTKTPDDIIIAEYFKTQYNKYYEEMGCTPIMNHLDNYSGVKGGYSGAKRVFNDPKDNLLKLTIEKDGKISYSLIEPSKSKEFLGEIIEAGVDTAGKGGKGLNRLNSGIKSELSVLTDKTKGEIANDLDGDASFAEYLNQNPMIGKSIVAHKTEPTEAQLQQIKTLIEQPGMHPKALYWAKRGLNLRNFTIQSRLFQNSDAVLEKVKAQFVRKYETEFTLEVVNKTTGETVTVRADFFGWDPIKKKYVYTDAKFTSKENFELDDAWTENQKTLLGWLNEKKGVTLKVKANSKKVDNLDSGLKYDSAIDEKDFEIQALVSEADQVNKIRDGVRQVWPK